MRLINMKSSVRYSCVVCFDQHIKFPFCIQDKGFEHIFEVSYYASIPAVVLYGSCFQLMPAMQCLSVIFQYLKLLRDVGPQER